ncbi:hypothetical protein PAAG_00597 [Paracoccidioides lutzii Pb01]|uniref:Uncharacterized protein n=1 Tax=Paracoccidioides lutzii (strain ATCC MYA-826 / Pb01) TaxID=502779 RepID=C1GQ02_PARBA|nr:hypothetical protein PAAG_00597 [Paracoccidioides lutzii Pb01]EEH36274.2 hypothetical protein PAAG_00597 [Paracoccidioides lutzii Pb01]
MLNHQQTLTNTAGDLGKSVKSQSIFLAHIRTIKQLIMFVDGPFDLRPSAYPATNRCQISRYAYDTNVSNSHVPWSISQLSRLLSRRFSASPRPGLKDVSGVAGHLLSALGSFSIHPLAVEKQERDTAVDCIVLRMRTSASGETNGRMIVACCHESNDKQ